MFVDFFSYLSVGFKDVKNLGVSKTRNEKSSLRYQFENKSLQIMGDSVEGAVVIFCVRFVEKPSLCASIPDITTMISTKQDLERKLKIR